MKTTREKLTSRGADRRILSLAAVAVTLLGSALVAQHTIEAAPYGEPSECRPGSPRALGLYYQVLDSGVPALRLEGGEPGQPALLAFSTQRAEMALPGGGTLRIGAPIAQTAGWFDKSGTFVHPLSGELFADDNDELFAQGFQPVTAYGRMGAELSGGLALTRRLEPVAPPVPEPEVPPVLVEECAGLLGAGHLEAALDLALNSKDDALTLDLGGNLEVPIAPGVTAGGKVAFKASVKRGEGDGGAAHYDVTIGADIAASAGVGVGFAGLGVSLGVGDELVWRYSSTHQVARALRSMAILLVVHDGIETACVELDRQGANIDRAIAEARSVVDRVRRAMRSWMPWSDNAIVRRMQAVQDRLRAKRREIVDRARAAVRRLIGWIAAERTFLDDHVHGFEVHGTAAVDLSAGTGFGDKKSSGGEWALANAGLSGAVGVERQTALRMERVPGFDGWSIENKVTFTESIAGAAGMVAGLTASGKRVIELSQKALCAADGSSTDEGITVKLTLDGSLRAVYGVVLTGQYGVGGEVVLEIRLRDLLDYGADAFAILGGDDTEKIARLLRAVPLKFHARGRYEAGFAIGISVDIDGAFKGGIGGAAMMKDCGPGFEYQGAPEGNTLGQAFAAGPLRRDDSRLMSRLDEVGGEVQRVMAR